ncbi:MAG: NifB/NifX family molybdenum-iron cluster-binding protein [Granulosicoccaceae bacterium]|jgi:predicted Fe-Mo cluster-binding NifX family protein
MPAAVIRVAVATREGVAVSEHFGHAKAFYIYDLSADTCRLVEQREVRHYCLGGSSDKSAMAEILDTIQDCDAVFVAKIGDGPTEKLAARGISAVSDYAWEEIEPALLDYAGKQFSG